VHTIEPLNTEIFTSQSIEKPTVSIGILCYNQKEEIGAVIESAFRQTHPVDEILVIDDGSTDGSCEYIRNHFPELKLLIHAQNRGRAAARTTLLEEASKDIIIYLDGNTIAANDLVEHLLSEYRSPLIAAVGGAVVEMKIVNVYDRWREQHGTSQLFRPPKDEDAGLVFGWGFSLRRSIGLEVGGFRPAGEDIDICLRIRKAGHRIVYTSAARVYHSRTDGYSSLMNMVYRWEFGGYMAFARNGVTKDYPQIILTWQNLWKSLKYDLFVQRDLGVAIVDLMIVPHKIQGILDARTCMRTGRLKWSRYPGM